MDENRQILAIMFTDMEGYTTMMQQNEQHAIAVRAMHRELFESITQKFNGKIIQYFGDGTVSVFKSSVDSVHCAIEMQLAFIKHEIPVRIGIHVGDIVYSKEDIIGDAVNIASRIEACAVAGSILISDKVLDEIRAIREINFKFLDAFDLKNITEAIPIFAIANEGLVIPIAKEIKGALRAERESLEAKRKGRKWAILTYMALIAIIAVLVYFQFFNKKDSHVHQSIAVLPFENLSTDEDSDIFTFGVTEDILTQLSKLKGLHVISRTSVLQYENTDKLVSEIANELGVSYILEGSIRKYGDKIRITTQLIDAENDEQIWAEIYDKTLTDIFEIQSEVSQEIVEALSLNISFDEQKRLTDTSTDNIEAYQLYIRGRKAAEERNAASIALSIDLFQQAIDLDPNYAEAYAEISNSIILQTYYAQADPKASAAKANSFLLQAESINPNLSRIYTVKGLMYNITRKSDEAKDAFEKAIDLSPNDVNARNQFATYYYYNRDYENQLEQAEIAYTLDPMSFPVAISYFTALNYNNEFDRAEGLLKNIERNFSEKNQFIINRSFMRLYLSKEDYEKAIPRIQELMKTNNEYDRFLGFCYSKLGDTLGARNVINNMKAYPEYYDRNYNIAVVFAGLKQNDSVFYYLDTLRNTSKRFNDRGSVFFSYLKDNPRYHALLEQHGIEKNEE